MSWAFLVYAIDVLSTDGSYSGWGFLLFFTTLVYIGLWIARLCEAEEANKSTTTLHTGKVVTLAKDFDSLVAGEKIVITNVDFSDETVKVRYPDGHVTNWLKMYNIQKVATPDETGQPFRDILKPLRRLVAGFAIICFMGIGYANFMPTKDTAYKMLAAYVGQTVVETPEVRQLAGNSIDFLNKAIKKYSDQLTASEEAEAAAKAKAESKNEPKQEK